MACLEMKSVYHGVAEMVVCVFRWRNCWCGVDGDVDATHGKLVVCLG